MPDDVATPEETGAMSIDDAAASLMPEPPREDEEATEPEEAETPQEATEEDPEEAEAEPGDDEGEEVEPEAEPDDDPEEAEADDDPEFTVNAAGEKGVKVKLSEIIKGYQRGADYQKKTAALAEERRSLEAAKADIESMRAKYEASLAKVAQEQEKEPDWTKLADELAPWEFQRKQAQWQAKKAQAEHARRELEETNRKRFAAQVDAERERLLERVPEWRDEKAFARAAEEMTAIGAKAYGFSPQELAMAADHRLIMLLRDAVAYRKMRAAKPAEKRVSKPAKPALKPGSNPTTGQRSKADARAARDKLRKSGSVDDAAAYLLSGD